VGNADWQTKPIKKRAKKTLFPSFKKTDLTFSRHIFPLKPLYFFQINMEDHANSDISFTALTSDDSAASKATDNSNKIVKATVVFFTLPSYNK
jgi:hypothetical protein